MTKNINTSHTARTAAKALTEAFTSANRTRTIRIAHSIGWARLLKGILTDPYFLG